MVAPTRKPLLTSVVLLAALGAGTLGGCRPKSSVARQSAFASTKPGDGPDAVVLLKRAMDTYAAMPSFKADCAYTMTSAGFPMASSRTVAYERPNRFKVVSKNAMGFVQTSVCDGTTSLEYDNMTGQAPRKERAPATIQEAVSMQMRHPMFCGSLLYQFFGGAANLDGLVDADEGPITLGSEEKAGDETARVVKFYGRQQYGHIEVLIGERTALVYRIRYDSDPLIKSMRSPESVERLKSSLKTIDDPKTKAQAEAALAMSPKGDALKLTTEERYDHPTTPALLPAETFALSVPKGAQPVDLTALPVPSDKPPVPLGSAAPDFTVTDLDGKPIRLSDLRGHPVLLDFWATWCGPCVASLPHTQELYAKGKGAGLQVVAISDEGREVVARFIKEKAYTFPTALDADRMAGKAYRTDAIPTTVVIDAEGRLVAYIVGGGQDEAIGKALAKVGLKIDWRS